MTRLAYGENWIEYQAAPQQLLGEILPRELPVLQDAAAAIRLALQNPLGTPPLREMMRGKRRIAIAISDGTRPVRSKLLLPVLLDELAGAGIAMEQISVLVALGIHRALTETELTALVGSETCQRVRVINHDPLDTILLGKTSRGTPLAINRCFAEADFKICTGNIDLHFFAGYAGGAKAMMPGLSTRAAIANNHRMQLEAGSASGILAGNPVREDIDEAGQLVGIDFILNLVQNESKEVVAVCAGDPILAHRAGCQIIDRLYKIPIARKATLVIASAGGHPKDVNLYQAQKALDNAAHAVQPGGTIVLLAACPEGYGEAVFAEWLQEANGQPQQVLQRLQRGFLLGGHKAAAIARVAMQARVILVSELPDQLVRQAFMEPAANLQQALQMAARQQTESIWLMPYACYTLPQEAALC
ncbi:MAG: nickel-dependent lactate racemase [Negativicutes bacterium]|nr:nickel-dependent lactate racemase [Negativicutes bacterium]